MTTQFVTDSGMFICKDAIHNYFSLSYYSTNWWSCGCQSNLGHITDSSPNRLIVCHTVLWWVCGAYHTKYSYLFRHPLWVTNSSNIISNWSGWIQYLLLIWRIIFVALFLFPFVLLAVTDVSLLFLIVLPQIRNHVLSTVNEDRLRFLVWLLLQLLSWSLLLSLQL